MVSFIIIAALGILVVIVILARTLRSGSEKSTMLVERRSLNSIAPLLQKAMTLQASLPMIPTTALRSEKKMIGVSIWLKYSLAALQKYVQANP